MAAEKLKWFQSQVVKNNIVGSFKLKASHEAFQQFVKLNIGILQQLKFQEINSRAIGKIMKSRSTSTIEHASVLTRDRVRQEDGLGCSANIPEAITHRLNIVW